MQREGRPSRSPLVRLTTASADLALVAPSGDAEPGMTSRAPRRSRFLALVSATALGLAACSTSTDGAPKAPLTIGDGCQPLLGGEACFLPYPSDFARLPDPTSPTGFRLGYPKGSELRTSAGAVVDVHGRARYDGFSLASSIVGALPGDELSSRGLPNVNGDPRASASVTSATLLLDTSTGALVEHYADLPSNRVDALETQVRQVVAVRAFTKLRPRTRYVVAFRDVRLASGDKAPPAPGFAKLRDRTAEEPALVAIRDRFDAEVFAPLEKAGVNRADLQLAWDFTTGTDEGPKRDMLRIRDLTLAYVAKGAPKVTIVRSTPRTGPTWKVVEGTLEVPLFTTKDAPGARLSRDASGAVVQNGTTQVPFSVHVPASLAKSCTKGRAIAYGHGFFGTQEEMRSAPATDISNRLSAVTFGIDWAGMSAPDRDWLAKVISEDPSAAPDFAERVHQAMASWMTLTSAVKNGLFDVPELRRPEAGEGACEGTAEAKAPVFDGARIHYYGPSLGAILGATLGALDPNLSRVALNVTGAGFSHMMPRAAPFGPLFLVVHAVFGNSLADQAYAVSLQEALDAIDPISYAETMLDKKLPGSPEDRRVLLQVGLGDSAVPPLGAFLHARALGIAQTSPAALPVHGVREAPAETLTSAMTLFDFGLGSNSTEPVPNPANKVHDVLRSSDEATRQIDAFLTPEGKIVHPCAGPCKLSLP